jgi:hypothetical protein
MSDLPWEDSYDDDADEFPTRTRKENLDELRRQLVAAGVDFGDFDFDDCA